MGEPLAEVDIGKGAWACGAMVGSLGLAGSWSASWDQKVVMAGTSQPPFSPNLMRSGLCDPV